MADHLVTSKFSGDRTAGDDYHYQERATRFIAECDLPRLLYFFYRGPFEHILAVPHHHFGAMFSENLSVWRDGRGHLQEIGLL